MFVQSLQKFILVIGLLCWQMLIQADLHFFQHSGITSIPQTCLRVRPWTTWHARTWLNRGVPVYATVIQDHPPMKRNILHCVQSSWSPEVNLMTCWNREGEHSFCKTHQTGHCIHLEVSTFKWGYPKMDGLQVVPGQAGGGSFEFETPIAYRTGQRLCL